MDGLSPPAGVGELAIKTLRGEMSCWNRWRYYAWRLAGCRTPLRCRLTTGERLILRPPPSSDLSTANEVFASQVYAPPSNLGDVRRVVDLGANVGYTLLYWARLFPQARITGFEPHPVHQRLIREHLRLNRLEDRVELIEAAAGTTNGTALLSDAESASSIVMPAAKTIPVPVVDVFDTLLAERVGLLKIDIEGAEYAVLSDSRFNRTIAARVLLEWHSINGIPSGLEWCENRLRETGFVVVHGWKFERFGVLWATATRNDHSPDTPPSRPDDVA